MHRLAGIRSSYSLRANTLQLKEGSWKLHFRHASRTYTTFNSAVALRTKFSIAASGQSLTASSQSSKPLLLSLERTIGPRAGSDQQLWETGLFSAEVYPDLPFAASWGELCAKLLSRSAVPQATASLSICIKHNLNVLTVQQKQHNRARSSSEETEFTETACDNCWLPGMHTALAAVIDIAQDCTNCTHMCPAEQ